MVPNLGAGAGLACTGDHMRSKCSPGLMNILGEMSFFISNIWTISDAILLETDKPGEYEVKINNSVVSIYFYLPYLSQKPLSVEGEPIFTLATANLGHAHNWVVCKAIEKRVGADVNLGVAEVNVLKKVGVVPVASYWLVGCYRRWIVYLFEIIFRLFFTSCGTWLRN